MHDVPLIIFFSGNGTNMQNLYEKLHGLELMGRRISIPAVLTNNPKAYGIERAKKHGITCLIVPSAHKPRREFEERVLKAIHPFSPKLCILAGFMRILTPHFLEHYTAINIHPSLLPLFKGAHAIDDSFQSDMKIAGVTVHFVTNELDSGSIIDQAAFHRNDYPTRELFTQKIHAIEHELFPKAIIETLKQSFLKADLV